VSAPDNQTVGQSLILECEVIAVMGITSSVNIVWRSSGEMLQSTANATSTAVDNSLVYTDSYIITILRTSDESRVIECEVSIDADPPVSVASNATLDVTGKYIIQL